MVRWAQESVIEDPELVRAMFVLLHRQYDGIGGQVGPVSMVALKYERRGVRGLASKVSLQTVVIVMVVVIRALI